MSSLTSSKTRVIILVTEPILPAPGGARVEYLLGAQASLENPDEIFWGKFREPTSFKWYYAACYSRKKHYEALRMIYSTFFHAQVLAAPEKNSLIRSLIRSWFHPSDSIVEINVWVRSWNSILFQKKTFTFQTIGSPYKSLVCSKNKLFNTVKF